MRQRHQRLRPGDFGLYPGTVKNNLYYQIINKQKLYLKRYNQLYNKNYKVDSNPKKLPVNDKPKPPVKDTRPKTLTIRQKLIKIRNKPLNFQTVSKDYILLNPKINAEALCMEITKCPLIITLFNLKMFSTKVWWNFSLLKFQNYYADTLPLRNCQ